MYAIRSYYEPNNKIHTCHHMAVLKAAALEPWCSTGCCSLRKFLMTTCNCFPIYLTGIIIINSSARVLDALRAVPSSVS